jgi:membrane protein YdbS with pleckstrin-like domain
MRLSEGRLPITVRQTRRAYLLSYLLALALLVLGVLGLLTDRLPSWVPQAASWAAGSIGIVWLIGLEINLQINRLRIEPDHVTLQKGLFSIEHVTVYYAKVTDVRIYQSLWARIMNYGSVFLNTAGNAEYELFLDKVPSPHQIRQFLEHLLKKYEHAPAHHAKPSA